MPPSLDVEAIRNKIRETYTEVARSPAVHIGYATGEEGLKSLGYDPVAIESCPAPVREAFCGVGNPFGLGAITSGEHVLDVGCGAGVDLVLASRLVGASGKVSGIDLTPAMVERALANLECAQATNASAEVASAEAIPFADATFDVVLSNGVLNLSPFKDRTLAEIHRVLKPGGRLQFADIVLSDALPADIANSLDAWAG